MSNGDDALDYLIKEGENIIEELTAAPPDDVCAAHGNITKAQKLTLQLLLYRLKAERRKKPARSRPVEAVIDMFETHPKTIMSLAAALILIASTISARFSGTTPASSSAEIRQTVIELIKVIGDEGNPENRTGTAHKDASRHDE